MKWHRIEYRVKQFLPFLQFFGNIATITAVIVVGLQVYIEKQKTDDEFKQMNAQIESINNKEKFDNSVSLINKIERAMSSRTMRELPYYHGALSYDQLECLGKAISLCGQIGIYYEKDLIDLDLVLPTIIHYNLCSYYEKSLHLEVNADLYPDYDLFLFANKISLYNTFYSKALNQFNTNYLKKLREFKDACVIDKIENLLIYRYGCFTPEEQKLFSEFKSKSLKGILGSGSIEYNKLLFKLVKRNYNFQNDNDVINFISTQESSY